MLSNKQNVLQLVALLYAHGVRDVVICPGSRDIPLTQTISHVPYFRCYSLTDERSAGFFALGIAQEQGAKVAVVVTSGSALANLHPAVCEAFYQQVPLMVISADRPEAWIGQMDGQTMTQPNLFQTLVRKAVSLPQVHDEESLWYCNRLINEALLELDHGVTGPVHINVPISDPFFDFTEVELPAVRVIKRVNGCDFSNWLQRHLDEMTQVLLVVGQNNAARWLPFTLNSKHILQLQQSMQVFSELPSNFAYIGQANALGDRQGATPCAYCGQQLDWILTALEQSCSPEELDTWTPQVVISLGGHIVSKKLKQFLRKHPPKYHLLINPRGEVSDLYMHLTHVVEAPWPDALRCLLKELSSPEGADARKAYVSRFAALYQSVFAQPLVDTEGMGCVNFIAQLLASMRKGSTLHLGNSSALRFAEFARVSAKGEIAVHCNRGINGIEGSVSAAVGAAYRAYQNARELHAKEYPLHYLIVGDLSFYYDFNGLWHSQLPPNLRIVVLNNGGGEIFRLLPSLKLDDEADRLVRGVHQSPALSTMRERFAALGIKYLEVGTSAEARGEAQTSVSAKQEASAVAMSELLSPCTEDSALTLVEYHCAPEESQVFTAAIKDLCARVRDYVAHDQQQ